jgi:hypothetical protein
MVFRVDPREIMDHHAMRWQIFTNLGVSGGSRRLRSALFAPHEWR